MFINTFAPWFSALASFAAVLTALHLARRGDRINLRITSTFLDGKTYGMRTGLIATIDVTNVGRRPATVTDFVFRTGFLWRRSHPWDGTWAVGTTRAVPAKLEDGDSLFYWLYAR